MRMSRVAGAHFRLASTPGRDVEIARAPDLPSRGVDDVERVIGRRAEDRREQPRDRAGAFQCPARFMDAIGAVLPGPRKLLGGGRRATPRAHAAPAPSRAGGARSCRARARREIAITGRCGQEEPRTTNASPSISRLRKRRRRRRERRKRDDPNTELRQFFSGIPDGKIAGSAEFGAAPHQRFSGAFFCIKGPRGRGVKTAIPRAPFRGLRASRTRGPSKGEFRDSGR